MARAVELLMNRFPKGKLKLSKTGVGKAQLKPINSGHSLLLNRRIS